MFFPFFGNLDSELLLEFKTNLKKIKKIKTHRIHKRIKKLYFSFKKY